MPTEGFNLKSSTGNDFYVYNNTSIGAWVTIYAGIDRTNKVAYGPVAVNQTWDFYSGWFTAGAQFYILAEWTDGTTHSTHTMPGGGQNLKLQGSAGNYWIEWD